MSYAAGAIERDENAGLAVRKNSGDPVQVTFDLTRTRWRIERHGDGVRVEGAVEGGEEIAPRRQHDRHGVSATDAGVGQPGGHCDGVGSQSAEAYGLRARFMIHQQNVSAFALLCRVPLERLEERCSGRRRRRRFGARGRSTCQARRRGNAGVK